MIAQILIDRGDLAESQIQPCIRIGMALEFLIGKQPAVPADHQTLLAFLQQTVLHGGPEMNTEIPYRQALVIVPLQRKRPLAVNKAIALRPEITQCRQAQDADPDSKDQQKNCREMF